MEYNQFSLLQSPAPAKRDRTSDEETSPIVQQQKQQRMELNDDQMTLFFDGLKKISELYHITELNQAKLNKLDGIESHICEIRKSQTAITEKLESIEGRVASLEGDMEAIKNQQSSSGVDQVVSEVQRIQSHTQQLAQSNLNNILIIRHFPAEISSDKQTMNSVITNIFNTLELDVHQNDYEASAIKLRDKNIAFLQMKFSSQLLKNKVLNKFRHMKKSITNEPPFIIDKLMVLPVDHELNGTAISMQNKLTKYNFDLLKSARKHAPSHFDFVYDDPDGRILARVGNRFHTIRNEEDIAELVHQINANRATKKPPPKQPSSSGQSTSGQTLRRSGRNQ